MRARAFVSALALLAGPALASSPTDWNELDPRALLEVVGGQIQLTPNFPASLRALDGRAIGMTGYIYVQRDQGGGTLYFLVADAPTCTQHMHAKPGRFMQLIGGNGEFSVPTALAFNDTVTVTGKLQIAEVGPNFFTLSDARIVSR